MPRKWEVDFGIRGTLAATERDLLLQPSPLPVLGKRSLIATMVILVTDRNPPLDDKHRWIPAHASSHNFLWESASSISNQAGVPAGTSRSRNFQSQQQEVSMLTIIDQYEVMYSANKFAPRIWLKSQGKYIGQLIFEPDGAALPADNMVNNQVNLYYHLEDFDNTLDLLRNEAPMYLLYSGSGAGFENGIKTTAEPVGEGELKVGVAA